MGNQLIIQTQTEPNISIASPVIAGYYKNIRLKARAIKRIFRIRLVIRKQLKKR